jgi:uncharacterized membrane protein YkvA (DUF1232 family)
MYGGCIHSQTAPFYTAGPGKYTWAGGGFQMNTGAMRSKIRDAVSHEKSTGTVAKLLRQFAMALGNRPKPAEVKQAVKFIQEYVEHVPAILEAISGAAQQAGLAREVAPILEVAEQYFLNPYDVIPDHLGLLGLMDDAYFALSLIQSISDNYMQRTGQALIPANLTSANRAIRILIGEPQASQLDLGIGATLQAGAIQQWLGRAQLPLVAPPVRDPIWGGATIDEVVDARLGAMGVV